MSKFKIALGSKVKDEITEFEGTVGGRCEYLTGCRQYSVIPKVDEKGKLVEGEWFDEDRLIVLRKGKARKVRNNGGPMFCSPKL